MSVSGDCPVARWASTGLHTTSSNFKTKKKNDKSNPNTSLTARSVIGKNIIRHPAIMTSTTAITCHTTAVTNNATLSSDKTNNTQHISSNILNNVDMKVNFAKENYT